MKSEHEDASGNESAFAMVAESEANYESDKSPRNEREYVNPGGIEKIVSPRKRNIGLLHKLEEKSKSLEDLIKNLQAIITSLAATIKTKFEGSGPTSPHFGQPPNLR